MNIRIELIKAENGHVIQIGTEEGQGVYVALDEEAVRKIVASSVIAYLDSSGSKTTPDETKIPRPNRATRRATKANV